MSTRLLYLHQQHRTFAGRRTTGGKRLLEALKAESERTIVSHIVCDSETAANAHAKYMSDAISVKEIQDARINVIFCEGGIYSTFANTDAGRPWKINLEYAEDFVSNGGVLIVADIDWNFASEPDNKFLELGGFSFQYGNSSPVYYVDCDEQGEICSNEVTIDASMMSSGLEDNLRDICNGVSTLLIHRPIEIKSSHEIIGAVISRTAGSLCDDMWWSPPPNTENLFALIYHPKGPMAPDFPGTFATARQLGSGFIVTITGIVTADSITSKCEGNITWFKNIIRHFQAATCEEIASNGFVEFRDTCVFLSHRSTDKAIVQAIGLAIQAQGPRVWLDSERMLPSDRLGSAISNGLDLCSHFAVFWSKECLGAKWFQLEIDSAISAMIEQKKPIFVVALDETPLPSLLKSIIRVDGTKSAVAVATEITYAIRSLRRRG